jgi:hypothetical protein
MDRSDDTGRQYPEGGEGTRPRTSGVLPLAVRQRLWDQLWTRLLAPPVAAVDRAPHQKRIQRDEGGAR